MLIFVCSGPGTSDMMTAGQILGNIMTKPYAYNFQTYTGFFLQ